MRRGFWLFSGTHRTVASFSSQLAVNDAVVSDERTAVTPMVQSARVGRSNKSHLIVFT
jgi:hypothetical protein